MYFQLVNFIVINTFILDLDISTFRNTHYIELFSYSLLNWCALAQRDTFNIMLQGISDDLLWNAL